MTLNKNSQSNAIKSHCITKKDLLIFNILDKKILLFLLFLFLIPYSNRAYTSPCFYILNRSPIQRNEGLKQKEIPPPIRHAIQQKHQISDTAKKTSSSKTRKVSNKKTSSYKKDLRDEMHEWIDSEILRISKLLEENKMMDQSLNINEEKIFLTVVSPIEIHSKKRTAIKDKMEEYIEAKVFLMDLMSFGRRADEFFSKFAHILTFQMSQYLAANGIFHMIGSYIPKGAQSSINNARFYKLTLLPESGKETSLSRLTRDFYNKYKHGWIAYEPLYFLKDTYRRGMYHPQENTIILSESTFLSMNVRNSIVLHELRHAKIDNNIRETIESPYHLSITRNKTGRPLSYLYPNFIHFSEMITHQQDGRILLRRLTTNPRSVEYNQTLEKFIFSMEVGLGISHAIETSLSSVLHSLNSPSRYSTEIKTESGQTWLNISLSREHFTLSLPLKYNGPKNEYTYNKEQKEKIKHRLEFALQIAKSYTNRYFIAWTKAKKAQRTRGRHRRTLILKTLQASQILSKKLDPHLLEESLKQLNYKVKKAKP